MLKLVVYAKWFEIIDNKKCIIIIFLISFLMNRDMIGKSFDGQNLFDDVDHVYCISITVSF
jgi:hypothetical protein